MRHLSLRSTTVTTDPQDPAATLVMSTAKTDPGITAFLHMEDFIGRVLTDAVTYHRQERQPRQCDQNTRPLIFAAISLTLGCISLGLSAASDPISWITSLLM